MFAARIVADMITSSGKVLEYHGQKYCVTCKQIRDHTCFWMSYRKSESNDDAYRKEERWNWAGAIYNRFRSRIAIPRISTTATVVIASSGPKLAKNPTSILAS